MNTQSQNTAILHHMQQGNEITALEALSKHGCMRLAARIGDLKDQGISIADRWVESNGKRFKAYRIGVSK